MRISLLALLLCATVAVAQTKSTGTKSAHPATHRAAAATSEPTATIDTTSGAMHCTLFPDKAPNAVANFIGLATGTKDWKLAGRPKHGVPLYNGTIFHRVIPEFMIQGGDPLGNGTGDPGYTFKDEIVPGLNFDRAGRLAYANSGPNTNGSQFFITEVPTPHLNGGYTIFGQCDPATVDLVKKIARQPTDPRNDRPFNPVKINKITIEQGSAAKAKPAGATAKKATAPKPQ